MENTGLLANTYTSKDSTAPGDSEVTFDDPMDDIIDGYREVALPMSVAEAAEKVVVGEPVSQTVMYTSQSVRAQYALSIHVKLRLKTQRYLQP